MPRIPEERRRKLRTWALSDQQSELEPVSLKGRSHSLIDLASNDYLGLSRNPEIIEAAKNSLDCDGIGAGSSRLITGSRPIHGELEKALANWLGKDSVLLFPSGFQANLAAVIALANRHTAVIADQFIHYSLLTGIRASRAKLYRFKHNDLVDLERLLKLTKERNLSQAPVVITESLFSMEGTSPNLEKMIKICKKFKAKLLVDEAHALGVMGPKGSGVCNNLSSSITIISGTFGKAFGGGGAFLACDSEIGDLLLQTSGTFRYTTALAPSLAASALAALKLIQNNPNWGQKLIEEAQIWRTRISKQGWNYPPGIGPILSLKVGSDQKALSLQSKLEQAGLLSIAIRPPTVPEGTSRLRIIVRRNLPEGTLEKLLATIGNQ